MSHPASLPFAVIRVSGEDARAFLHNLLTNDIKKLMPGTWCFAGLCTPKGRLLASFHVCCDAKSQASSDAAQFLLLLSADLAANLLKKLRLYVLRSKVHLSDESAHYQCLGFLSQPPAPFPHVAPGMVVRCASETSEPPAFLLGLAAQRWLALLPAADNVANLPAAVNETQWRQAEIDSMQPRITAATQDLFVPQMLHFDSPQVDGVSFSKGCYPGQEVVARAHYLGKVKRRMFRVFYQDTASHGFPHDGMALYRADAPGQACGHLLLSAPTARPGAWMALAVMHESAAELASASAQPTTIHLATAEGPVVTFDVLA